MKRIILIVLMFLVVLLVPTLAATIQISQAGADPNTIMVGKPFTVTVSGLSGSGTVSLVLPSGFSLSESTSKSFSSGTTSVSWTTVVATQKLSAQTISATISVAGTPSTVTSDTFDVKLPPSLTLTITPTSVSVDQGSTFLISLNIQNSGETTAKFGTITISNNGLSIASGCSPIDIAAGESAGIACSILASSSGSKTLTVTLTPTNADPVSKSISVNVVAPTVTTTTVPTEITPSNVTTQNITVTTQTGITIQAGENATITIENPDLYKLQEIIIHVIRTVSNVKIHVSLTTHPAGGPSVVEGGTVYKYIEITKENITDADIANVTIKFKVDKAWINANTINVTTIALYRYSNGNWEKLNTSKVGEDEANVYFSAISPSLSIFAIAGEKLVTKSTLPTTTTTTIPSRQAGTKLFNIVYIIAAMLAIGIACWYFKKKINIRENK